MREQIAKAMRESRREELNDLNREIEQLQFRIDHTYRDLVRKKAQRHYLLESINEGVTDKQIADVLTSVMVGQGVLSGTDDKWLKDSDLETDA